MSSPVPADFQGLFTSVQPRGEPPPTPAAVNPEDTKAGFASLTDPPYSLCCSFLLPLFHRAAEWRGVGVGGASESYLSVRVPASSRCSVVLLLSSCGSDTSPHCALTNTLTPYLSVVRRRGPSSGQHLTHPAHLPGPSPGPQFFGAQKSLPGAKPKMVSA